MKKPAHLGLGFLALALTLSGATKAARADELSDLLDAPDSRWHRGPARYLLDKSEATQFRKLKSDEERKSFIEAFWQRRDPSPGTPENEFKDRFEERLRLAVQRFGPPHGLGWEDDRGEAIALLGAPEQVFVSQREAGPSASASLSPTPGGNAGPGDAGGGPAARRRARFVYEHEVFPGAPNPLELEFTEDSSGGFRLLGRFDFSAPILTGVEHIPVRQPEPEPEVAAAEPEPEPAPPEPEPPAPPTPQRELLDAALAEGAPEPTLPISARLDFYKTKEADTFATVTVSVGEGGEAGDPPIVAARLQKEGEEGESVALEAEDSFAPAAEVDKPATGGDLLFQAGRNVPAGEYSLAAVVKDPATGKIGVVKQAVIAPDFHAEEFQLSSVTLARKVEPAAGESTDAGGRFVLGKDKVIPAANAVFHPGEDVWIYFQIYNTANDSASGQPKLKVSYTFEKVEEKGNRMLGGKPIVQFGSNTVQAYALSVTPAWPEGDYRVTVKVDDQVAGAAASGSVSFKVVKPK